MKKYIANIVIPVLMLCGLAACSDWTEAEPSYPINKSLAPKSPEYYAKLRDWKLNNKHPRTFGWYGNWTGKGASGEHRLMGLPDSVDFVSMWGNWWGLSKEQMEDKRQAYEIKGLRVKICFIIGNIGDQLTPREVRENYAENGFPTAQAAVNDFWGWGSGSEEEIEAAIRKYAQALTDTIIKYDFHGFDYDLERDYAPGGSGNIASYQNRITIFLDEMSKTCGPKSGTNRLLCVDGQPDILAPECAEMLDFFIMQSYYASGPGGIENGSPRVNSIVRNFEGVLSKEEIVSRIIATDDFEQSPETGGRAQTFTTRDGRLLPPIWGMADYFTEDGYQIGGAGIYHMEYDYKNTYSSIQTAHKGKNMDLTPGARGTECYAYLNGIIRLLNHPVNPAAKKTSVE